MLDYRLRLCRAEESRLSVFERGIWYLNTAVALAVVLRLTWTGLARIYPWLTLYLFADVLSSGGGALFRYGTNAYAEFYMGVQLVLMVLAVFVVLELYRLSLADQPALGAFGRRIVVYVLSLAALIAVCGLAIDARVRPLESAILHRFFTLERTVDLAVSVFLLMIGAFLIWFPVQIRRNVALYVAGFVIFFLTQAATRLMSNILPQRFLGDIDTALYCVSILGLITWVFLLDRESETKSSVVTGHQWNPAAAERLTGQLESINASLVRFGKK